MNGYIFYKDRWLAPNGEAYALHQKKEWSKLDILVKFVDANYKRMSGA